MTEPAGPLRLQLYVSDLRATGVVRNAVAIANAAANAGWAVRLLAASAEGELRAELNPQVHPVALLDGAGDAPGRKGRQRRALLPYRREVRAFRPHVLFSAGNHGHMLSTLAWTGTPGCKVVRISNALQQEGRREGLLREWKLRTVTGLADRLVLVSHALAGEPLLAPLVASGKAVVIPNGVDVERVRRGASAASPHPWLRDGEPPLVLAVGRQVAQKNFAVLLEGFASARRERPMRLLFLGEGTAAAIAQLRDRAGQLGVAADVTFEPPTPNPFAYMARAALFALPSLWEGSSNVLLEALACGTPVAASTTAGDAAIVLDEGRYGLLVDPHDPAAWSGAILRQLGGAPVLPATRAEGFSREAAIARYLALFSECANSARVSPRP